MTYAIAGTVIFVMFFIVITNNNMVMLHEALLNSWAKVDVQLKKKDQLVTNLVEAVKGYAGEDHETVRKVTESHSRAMAAGSVAERSRAESVLAAALEALLAAAESYPELKDGGSFQKIRDELEGAGLKIASARHVYNDIVRRYNNRLSHFPTSIVAARLGFKPADYFNTAEVKQQGDILKNTGKRVSACCAGVLNSGVFCVPGRLLGRTGKGR